MQGQITLGFGQEAAAAYLAAIIDGEGWILVNINRQVGVFNTDRDIIDAVIECCQILALRHVVQFEERSQRKNRQDGWRVIVTGKDSLIRIRDQVPLRASRKRVKLDEAIAACKQKPRPPREWIVERYWRREYSLQELADEWGVRNSTSAWCWMKFYGISRRSHAESNALAYQRGRR